MINILPHWVALLVLSFLYNPVFAHLVPYELQSREICVQDDYLLGLQYFPDDSSEWCRTKLGIADIISTAFTVTVRR